MPPGVSLGTTRATGTIIDNDGVTVSIADSSGSEGGNAARIFAVTLSATVTSAVVLDWSVTPGTAALSDLRTTSGTVTISARNLQV